MKKIVIISGIVNCLILILVVSTLDNSDKIIYTNNKSNKVVNANSLTMMYETEAGSGEYTVSSDTSWPQEDYIFNSELSGCENGGTLLWNSETNRVVMQTNSSDRCYVYFDVYELPTLANYIKSLYTEDGVNGLYFHDGSGSYTNFNLEAGDNSYRYTGANPNNYVCFGSDVTPCPNDNLYRIIGIFNINDNYQTKLIKNTSIGKYAWNTEYTTEWNTSDIRVILNNTYYNSLSGKYQNLIYNTTWSIGGIRLMNGMYSNAKEAYNYEIGANKVNKTDIAKVALMYLSDYYYSASPTYWNYSGNNIDDQSQSYASAKNENWIFSRLDEFTLSYIIDFSSFIFTITDSGAINSASSPFIPQNDVRPSFYLNSDVAYVSGDGSISNPYRIN